MRIVEHQNDLAAAPCRILRAVGISSAIFSLVVTALMVANLLSLRTADPIHAPALLKLIEQLKATPQDQNLKEQIREMDWLARRAYFSSRHYTEVSALLLAGGLVVAIVAFKSIETYQHRFPYPDPKTPKDDLAAQARWMRQAVSAAGLVLGGFALIFGLLWRSPLDEFADQSRRPAKTAAATSPAPAKPLPATLPSREEWVRNWPCFLGPANGRTTATNLPLAWDAASGQGILWKLEIPKPGFSSPIVWSNLIFLTGADQKGGEVYAIDGEKGKIVWRHAATNIPGSPAEPAKTGPDTGNAAPTMVTDGSRVFALFANGDLLAVDMEGKRAWARNLGLPDNPYGHGSSLAVSGETLLVQFDQKELGALHGIDARTGENRWKTARDFGPSWSTPLVAEISGTPQIILAAAKGVAAYDPATGKELWRVALEPRGDVAPSPVLADGILYVSADSGALTAIDIAKRAPLWKIEEMAPGVCTPIIFGDFLIYGGNDAGIVCRNAKSGAELWLQNTDEGFYASPVLAGDRVYLQERSGAMHIFKAGAPFTSLGQGKLGETAVCTPAVLGNSLICRGVKHLFRIGS